MSLITKANVGLLSEDIDGDQIYESVTLHNLYRKCLPVWLVL